MHLISFLGTGRYHQTTYRFNQDPTNDFKTQYIALAIAKKFQVLKKTQSEERLLKVDRITLFATDMAKEAHFDTLLSAFEQEGVVQPELVSMPNGENAEEQWKHFNLLLQHIPRGKDQTVIFDITHGFRSQPFFAAAVINFIRSTWHDSDLPDMRVLYGEFRRDENNPENSHSLVWDMSTFVNLLDWSSALQSFMKTGHGGDLARLARSNNNAIQKQAQAGLGRPALLGKLALALNSFSDDISTVRCESLIVGIRKDGQRKNGLGSAKHLWNVIEESRAEVTRHMPPLAVILDDLQSRIGGLTSPSLFGEQGHRAMAELAKLYVTYERYPEALITLREGWISLYANTAKSDDELLKERSVTETRFRQAEGKHAGTIADFRNDVGHGGFNKKPLPAATLRIQTEELVNAFAEASAKPIAAAPIGKTYFVSRHPGAIAWAESEGLHVDEQLSHLEINNLKAGDRVIGTLPINLVAQVNELGGHYFHLLLGLPEQLRGKELDADEMRKYGARLQSYSVQSC